MKMLPKYTKVLTLGASRTERALLGEVVLQEKVDGSMFRFGLNENHELILGSKSVNFEPGYCEKMFKNGVEYLESIDFKIKDTFSPDTYFFCEYLQKNKHNVLKYDRTPENYLVLFDVMMNGKWVEDREELMRVASLLGLEAVPELWRGQIEAPVLDFLKNLIHTTMSFLGGVQIEGIVIKNYNENIEIGSMVFPLFTKLVQEGYKEKHNADWKSRSPKNSLQDFFDSFCNENRWKKAISHLKEKGELKQAPQDIGQLIVEVQEDIKTEEGDNIRNFLFRHFISDIERRSVRGLAEWYKETLINENLIDK